MIAARSNGTTVVASNRTIGRARDPMAAVMGLGRNTGRVVPLAVAMALAMHGTAAAHAALLPVEMMKWSQAIGRAVHARIVETYDIDLTKAPEPPPPPPPEPEPEKEQPKPAPATAPKEARTENTPPPSAAAAKAGAVLTQAPDPNEPVDLTNAFVSGNADTYAGGVTQATGTSDTAVYARKVSPQGTPGGTGQAPAPSAGPDRSRPAKLAGGRDWKCDFPPEADIDQIDQAYVILQVATRADGTPERVSVLSEPGHGFARAARLCAMKERYEPALDRDGNPTAGQTKSIRIHFER